MTKFLLFITFPMIAANLIAQSECFNDCSKRMITEQMILMDKKVSSVDSLLSVNRRIIENLKGCQFPKTFLNKLDGGNINIDAFQGKLVFIHFWFSSCAPCVAEIPSINKLINEYDNTKVVFLAISNDDRKRIVSFLNTMEFKTIQTYIDQSSMEKYFCIIDGYPMNMLLNKEGKVIDAWTGGSIDATDQNDFYNKIKTLLDANL
jgi:thiol-disulfide isomerase/thioredoxin